MANPVTVAELLVKIGVDAKDAQKAQKDVENLRKETSKSWKKVAAEISAARGNFFKENERALKKFNETVRSGAMRVSEFVGGIAKRLALLTVAVGAGALNTAAKFETLQAQLKTVTGSAEAARVAFEDIRQLATQMPFSVEEVTESFIKLKGAGLDPTEERMKAFADIAAASGKSLTQFSEAVLDAAQGEFERLKEFNIRAADQGDTIAFTFRGVTTEVQDSSAAITDFLQQLGTENFAGAAAEQMDTLNGAISNAKDTFANFLNEVAQDGPLQEFKKLLATLTDSVDGPNGLAKALSRALTKAIATVRRALESGLLDVLKTAVEAIALLVENWDILLGLLAGAKTASAFATAAAGFQSLGLAAGAALGPIGAIGGAMLALLPIANKVGNAIASVLIKEKSLQRRVSGSALAQLTQEETNRLASLNKRLAAAGGEDTDAGREIQFEINSLLARGEGRARGAQQAKDTIARIQAEVAAEEAAFAAQQDSELANVPMGPEFIPNAFKAPRGGGGRRGSKSKAIKSPVTISEFFSAAARGELKGVASRAPSTEGVEPTVAITINNHNNTFDMKFNIKGQMDPRKAAEETLAVFQTAYQSKMTQAGQQIGSPTVVR